MERDRIDRVSMAVVQIHSPESTGSGSLVEGSGLIYTNRHVVEGFYEFDIHAIKDPTEPAQPVFKAELVGFSDEFDFAVLRITTDMGGNQVSNPHQFLSDLSPANLYPELRAAGLREVPARGDQIAIFGYPGIGDNELVFTTGIISSVLYDTYAGARMPIWYRTNAEMSPGNSGGIATNAAGDIIGIPTYVRTESRTGGRLGSLLSMHVVQAIVDADALIRTWESSAASPRQSQAEAPYSGWDGNQLDFSLDPYYGEYHLGAGFVPDPYRVSVTSGGSVPVSYLAGDCVGFAAQAPDYRLHWAGGGSELRILFDAGQQGDDTVLLVNMPDGSWACNDDANADTVNPMVVVSNPPAGVYDIWVASYYADSYIDGTLHITERGLTPDGNLAGLAGAEGGATSGLPAGSDGLEFSLDPVYGSIRLEEWFTPDPHQINGVAGGPVDVSELDLGPGCTGYASSAPDFRLHWTGGTDDLTVFFEVDQPGNDTVLIINTPSREWICNDDAHSSTLNPLARLRGQPAGQFDIWVATFRSGEFFQGKLTVTETSITP
ncbi:MAG: serine protease [Wenzhouxiangella sp.]|nr:serine protease [Wenzhouxiangella sp.]